MTKHMPTLDEIVARDGGPTLEALAYASGARKGLGIIGTSEAARRLGVSTRRVQQLVANGAIAAERLGTRTLLVSEADVERVRATPRHAGRPRKVRS